MPVNNAPYSSRSRLNVNAYFEDYVLPYYNGTYGFLNGTRFYGGPRSVVCGTTIRRYIALSTNLIIANAISAQVY